MKRLAQLVLIIVVTGLLSWWAFRDAKWDEQWQSLREANYLWLIPYLGLLGVIHLCRTLRWGYLLSGLERVRFKKLNEASAIGFMMLLVLPFRLGEFARPYLIAQRSRIRKSAAMTSVVLERIVDGLLVATLLRVLLFFVPGDSDDIRYVKWGSTVMFAVFGGGLAFLLFALWQQKLAVSLVRRTIGRFVPKLADKAAEIVDAFVGAMRQLPDAKNLIGFFVATFVYWGVNGAGMAMVARAFDLHLTLFQGYVVMCVLVAGLMVPSAPGMIGAFQAATKVGLALFLPPALVSASGLAYANVVWFTQTAQQILTGLVFMSATHMSFRDVTRNMGDRPELPSEGASSEPAQASAVGLPPAV
ncbi:MAG: flippase-like domain-containing protein [Myxococcaceae bacterium]|nr:flippase-like domain-containing protein [Myxococcaceae bacterium]